MHKLLISLILLTITIFTGNTALAVEHSANVTVGLGYKESLAVDFYLKQLYEPWFIGEYLEIRPATSVGATLWSDLDERGYSSINDAGWVNNSQYVWGFFGTVGLEIALHGEYIQPYIAGHIGPAYISETEFVDRSLGGHFIFTDRLTLGFRFGTRLQHNLSFQAVHYSNAGLYKRNSGYNAYSLVYGFTFR